MSKTREQKNMKHWDLITASLVNIVNGFKIKTTGRDYFNVCYFGTAKELRKECTRIINILDSLEKEGDSSYGRITETWGEKVPDGTSSSGSRDSN